LALLIQWSRSDHRLAQRTDRAAERDNDAALAAYNAMYAELAKRVTEDEAVDAAVDTPPQTTRAKLRGDFITAAQEAGRVFTLHGGGILDPTAVLPPGRGYPAAAAGRYAIVTTIEPTSAQRTRIRDHGGALVVVGSADELGRWLGRGGTRAALVRPDGAVQSTARELSALCAAMPRFHSARVVD
ncbi:proteasome accessory factor PafA2 family protein, partial [Nocardia abscessus]|uniref:proteasome accessory factor PafA2 family protein n=1 Tax=Nocardia abscessus TaxID=120957 RepID=UPI00245403D2